MMYPVLLLTHNCLELTKRCITSIRAQDVPAMPFVIDNGSTDGTQEWLQENVGVWDAAATNVGVSPGWNEGLNRLFRGYFTSPAEQVLVVNNDTALPSWFLRRLLEFHLPFVTGISVGSIEEIAFEPAATTPTEGPDFSAFLIQKSAWEKIGPFDDRMVFYAQDLDYHLRAHRLGVKLLNGHIPFYHKRSSTMNSAPPREQKLIRLRADADRTAFQEKWGMATWSEEYKASLTDETFGIDAAPPKSVNSDRAAISIEDSENFWGGADARKESE